MFIDLITMAINAAFVAALVLVFLARRWEEQHAEFLRLAGWTGLAASAGALIANLVLALDPEFMSWSAGYVLLLLMSAIVPLLALTGSILILTKRRRGVRLLVAGSLLWLFTVAMGYVGSAVLKG
ncbi:MAG: hypothetical protein K0S68_1089 [Candidatus Saccharibacteria bacterium]|jgi:hypothetical protein|nr:hypothetical protein [Candidatus Saccharibacteria bacterium]